MYRNNYYKNNKYNKYNKESVDNEDTTFGNI